MTVIDEPPVDDLPSSGLDLYDPAVLEPLTAEEAALAAILFDESGLDQAEFLLADKSKKDLCYRAKCFQWPWWRDRSPKQFDQCVAAGQLVLTSEGYYPVEEVEVGMLVLTHRNRWRKVTEVWCNGVQPVVKVTGQGVDSRHGVVLTPDHRLYARRVRRGSQSRDGHKGKVLGPTEWLAPQDWQWNDGSGAMTTNWASPASVEPLPLPPHMERPPNSHGEGNFVADITDPNWMWLFGLYLAEGWCSRDGLATVWSVHTSEVEKVHAAMDALGLRYSTSKVADEECFQIRVTSRAVVEWLRREGGHLAHGKRLGAWVFGAPEPMRRAVFEGALYGDGHTHLRKKPHHTQAETYTTVSEHLALGMQLLGQTLGYSTSVWSRPPGSCVIEGRTCPPRETWMLSFTQTAAQQKAFTTTIDGTSWSAVKTIEPAGNAEVWDLTVEEDHSFTVANKVHSNCSRDVGKSEGMMHRVLTFSFTHPGSEMAIFAPEHTHVDKITERIEAVILSNWVYRQLVRPGRSGITRRPFKILWAEGARLITSLPQRTGIGVKGTHAAQVHLEEAQDLSPQTWKEIPNTVAWDEPNAKWFIHGVSRGVRDDFFDYSTKPELGFRVHRLCLPGDSLVYTPAGPVAVQELSVGTEVYSVDGEPRLVTATVTGHGSNGEAEIWEMETRSRRLRATGNHPVLCVRRQPPRRAGSRLIFEWRRMDCLQPGDYVVVFQKGLESVESASPGAPVLLDQMTSHSPQREVPAWVWSASRDAKLAFLHGYLVADGSLNRQKRGQDALAISCSSRELVRQLRVLALELGIRVTKISSTRNRKPSGEWADNDMHYCFLYVDPADFRQIPSQCINTNSSRGYQPRPIELDAHLAVQAVLEVGATGQIEETFDIEVSGTEAFVAEGVVVHNTQMHREDWNDERRQDLINQLGGSVDSPDYKRNVKGEHGDTANVIFILENLMAGVDTDESSWFNLTEYMHFDVRGPEIQSRVEAMGARAADAQIEESSQHHIDALQQMLDFGPLHRERYQVFWAGMDVGLVDDPSEILIFAEYHPDATERRRDRAAKLAVPLDGQSRLKLINRISMRWIPAPLQADAIMWVIAQYPGMRAFSMDSTGNGLPVFQELQKRAGEMRMRVMDYGDDSKIPIAAVDARTRQRAQTREALTTIKGYNFSGKVLVGFDEQKREAMKSGATPQEVADEAGIKQWVKEAATDYLRGIVDTRRHLLPYDTEVTRQWNAQTWAYGQSGVDKYGRRKTYSAAKVHTLDAARMAILGRELDPLEQFLREPPKKRGPVIDRFIAG